MIDLSFIQEDRELSDILSQKPISDPWVGTPIEGYVKLPSNTKGQFGEIFVSKYMENRGSVVLPRNGSHDRIIDGYRTEIKFAVSKLHAAKRGDTKETFIINRISKKKDWDRLIFVAINIDISKSKMVWFTKEDFLSNIESDLYFAPQTKETDDDYIVQAWRMENFWNAPFVKDIEAWFDPKLEGTKIYSNLDGFFDA